MLWASGGGGVDVSPRERRRPNDLDAPTHAELDYPLR